MITAACLSLTCMLTSAAADDDIAAAVRDTTRLESQRARDDARKPEEILSFAGVKSGDQIADLAAGSGYYTAILSRVAGDHGKVFAVDPVRIFEAFPNASKTFPAYLEADPRANIDYSVQKFDELTFPEPLDVVVMGLYYHDTIWTGADRAAMNNAIFDALKSGGVYLVIDHNAKADSDEAVTKELHRMLPGVTKPEILAAGFEWVGESDALANPEDPLDVSVFDEGIRGRTDRFVYLFRKP
ncbi:MAG: methyltransferase [Hyphococcus sp.]|nr:MAG: methyltransferase [Marinicaulis sp.]